MEISLHSATGTKSITKVDHSSKIAAYASFGFDASMMDIYGAIANGAELHIIPEEIRLDFIALQRYFEENGVYPFLL